MSQTAIPALSDLIGRPWRPGATGPDAYDCWGLVAHVSRALFGRELPDAVAGIDLRRPREVIGAIRASAMQRRFLPAESPRPGDLVLMARRSDPVHVGIWIEPTPGAPGVLHAVQGQGVLFQSLAQVRAGWTRIEFRRDAGPVAEAVAAQEWQPGPDEAAVVVVRDVLDPLEGARIVTIRPGASPAGAIAALDGLPAACWLCLDAEPLLRRHPETGEDEWQTRRIGPGEVLWVLPPLPLGDDGSSVFATLAAIAVAIAAPYLIAGLGIAALGTTASTLQLAGKLAAAGLALGANLIVSAFVPGANPVNRPAEAPSPTYTLSPPGNTIRPGAMVPVSYGTMRRQPDLLARPWGDYADNEHTLYLLLCVGQGNYRINELGIEDTAVWAAGSGFTGVLEDVEIEIVPPGSPVTLFPANVRVSSEVGGQVMAEPAPDQSHILGPFVAVPAGERARRLSLDFIFPRGLFDLSAQGRATTASVDWTVDIREIDDAGLPVGAWVQAAAYSRAQATTDPQRLTGAIDVTPGRYEVRARRTSASTVGNPNGQDELLWAGLRAVIAGTRVYGDVTAIAIRMRANETSSQGATLWYVDATRRLPWWDSAAQQWTFGPTERIEAAALDVIKAGYGLGLTDASIDLPALQALAEVWEDRGDVCCITIDTEQAAWDVLDAVLQPGRTRAQFVGNTVTFVRDQPRAIPSRLVTHADILRGSLSVDRLHFRRDAPNVVTVRYRDRVGQLRTVLCQPPGVTSPRPAIIDMKGVVDPEQAFREGIYLAASNNLRRRYVSFTMLGSGRSLMRGDLVALSHPRPSYGRPARVVSRTGLALTLSEPHGIAGPTPHYMAIARPDGGFWGPVLVTAGPGPADVLIDAADLADVIATPVQAQGYDRDPFVWMVTEAGLAPPATGSTELLDGVQSEPTRVAVGPQAAETLKVLIVEMTPNPDGTLDVLAIEDHPGVHSAETGLVAPVPPPATVPTIRTGPAWLAASARVRVVGGEHSVVVAGPSVPGARAYVASWSTDGGASWSERYSSLAPRIVFPAPEEASFEVRFAAVGRLRGPWGYATLDGS